MTEAQTLTVRLVAKCNREMTNPFPDSDLKDLTQSGGAVLVSLSYEKNRFLVWIGQDGKIDDFLVAGNLMKIFKRSSVLMGKIHAELTTKT